MTTYAPIFVVATQAGAETSISRCLGEDHNVFTLGVESPDELLKELEIRGKPSILFCEVEDYNSQERAQMIEAVCERYPELPVVGVGTSESASLMLAAMRAGVRDFFVMPRDEAKLAAQVGKLLRRAGAAAATAIASTGGSGKLFLVMGAQGQESIAFLANHLALAFCETAKPGNRVLICDAAMPAGSSAVMLNMSPSYLLTDAVNDVARCDNTLIETAFARHRSGCYLLGLPEDGLQRPAIASSDLVRLLQVFRTLFAVTVISIDGSAGNNLLRSLVAEADRSLVLSDQSILRSRQCKTLLRQLRLEEAPLERTGLVVDNYRRRLGLEPTSLAELLDLPLMAALTTETVSRIQAMNSGEAMFTVAPKDPYCDAVRKLALLLQAGQTTGERPSGGLLSRLFNNSIT